MLSTRVFGLARAVTVFVPDISLAAASKPRSSRSCGCWIGITRS
jgi:hypothetical protein